MNENQKYNQVNSEQRKSKFWIWLAVGIVFILIIGVFYFVFRDNTKSLEQEIVIDDQTITEPPETFIFSDFEGEIELDDIENAIRGSLQ